MQRSGLSVLMPAALWTASLLPTMPAMAQTPKPAHSTRTTPTQKSVSAPPPAADSIKAEAVGTVDNTKITFGEVLARMQKDDEPDFAQAVATVVGAHAASALFGASAKPTVTISVTDVLLGLRQHPTAPLASELETMIRNTALDMECVKQHITITVADVDVQLATLLKNLRDQGKIPMGVTDDQFLEMQHITRATLRGIMRPQVELKRLVRKDLETRIGHSVGPDDFIQLRHILINAPANFESTKPEDKKAAADALAKAAGLAADIRAGKITFEKAAEDNSDDPGSKTQGGELGIGTRGIFVKQFEDAAFAQKAGEVGPPVRSKFGYHIILVEKKGKDLPQADRDQFLENYINKQYPYYVGTLTTVLHRTTNKLAALAPQQPQMRGAQPSQ